MRFSRPSAADFITWLIVSLLLGSTTFTHAQTAQPVNLSNSPSRAAHGFTEDNEEQDPANNFGTGVRVGGTWIDVSRGRMPANLEVAAYHQHALSRTFSVQGEVAYYRQRTTSGPKGGLRLPLLLVTNLFTNVSLHLGPQVQWQPATAATADAFTSEVPRQPTPHFSAALVAGVEARVYRARFGVRYQSDFSTLTNLEEAGQRLAHAWNAGLIQGYVGFNIKK